MKILSKLVTPADVTAALNRISAVADSEDVNMVRAELARLRRVLGRWRAGGQASTAELARLQRVLDAESDDDVDYAYVLRASTVGTTP